MSLLKYRRRFIIHRKENINYFNNYKINEDGYCEFYIINKKKEKFTVKIDTDILGKLVELNRSWNAKWAGWGYYICCCEYIGSIKGKSKYKIHYLHRWIVDANKNEFVDHINHDTFDNRKHNLRIVTKSKNATHRKGANSNNKSTGVRNVTHIKQSDEYWVQFMKNGVRHKWIFPNTQFNEACEFAIHKRKEIFGNFAGES